MTTTLATTGHITRCQACEIGWQNFDRRVSSLTGFTEPGTGFEHFITGVGDSPQKAFEDALEIIDRTGLDTEGIRARILAVYPVFATNDQSGRYSNVRSFQGGEQYYHMGIRYNVFAPN